MSMQYTDTFKQETLPYIPDNPHKTRTQIEQEVASLTAPSKAGVHYLRSIAECAS